MRNKEAAQIIDWDKPVVLVMSALVHIFHADESAEITTGQQKLPLKCHELKYPSVLPGV
jgi:hypothetical protein